MPSANHFLIFSEISVSAILIADFSSGGEADTTMGLLDNFSGEADFIPEFKKPDCVP